MSLFAKKELWGAEKGRWTGSIMHVIWNQMQDSWPQTLYLIVHLRGMDLYGSCQVFWEVFQRSISTNCKVNSDIQTASIISKAQGTGWHNRSNTYLVLNGEERHFWIMSKMSQEEYLTCHVYLLSTLDSRAFNQPSSSLPLPKFGQTIAIRLSIYYTKLKRSCIGPFASLSQQKSTSV